MTTDATPRDPEAIALALAQMVGQHGLRPETEAEIVGRALAALALGAAAPDLYVANVLASLHRAMLVEVGGVQHHNG